MLHSKQEKNWAQFVRERIELFIGIYISMKSTFPFKPESSEKMVKTSKFVSQKQNNTKKNWRQTIKAITNEFECFDVRPLHCNFLLFTTKKNNKSCTALFLLISCLKTYSNKFSHALLFWYNEPIDRHSNTINSKIDEKVKEICNL